MATKALNESNFKETVANGIVLVDFWAPWCGPCRVFGPVFEKVSEAHPDVVFGKVDTEDESRLASSFGIQAIPTLMAFRDGILLFEQAGALPATALNELVEQVKGLDMVKVRADVAAQQSAPKNSECDGGCCCG
ncbi:MAG: thioredoxin [Polyangia bacterium]